MQLPEDEKHTYPKNYLYNNLAIFMGGRVAEEVCLGQMTTGAGNDIERATEMARKMVCEWGMSEKMGPLTYGTKEEQVFLGKDFSQQKNFSDQTAKLIDQEVKALVMGGYENARGIITEHRDSLEKMALALLDRETLNASEVKEIVDGKVLPTDGQEKKLPEDDVITKEKKPQSKSNDDSEGIMGGGLPDPHPA
jgi:cell division protease FtsH